MKKLISFVAALAFSACAVFSQLQTNGVTPTPLAFTPTLSTLFQSNTTAHAVAQANTNNLITSGVGWANFANGGWATNTDPTILTNGVIAHPGATFGFVNRGVAIPYQGLSTWIARVTIAPIGLASGDQLSIGFSTNTSGTIPLNNNNFIGFAFETGTSGGHNFRAYRGGGAIGGGPNPWGNDGLFTNATYTLYGFTDPTNIGCTLVYPGNTNEFRAYMPWASQAATGLSNFCAMWFGTNGLVNGMAIRTNGVEIGTAGLYGNSHAVYYTFQGLPGAKNARIEVPYNYDAVTNVPDLLLFAHGNTGSELGTFDSLDPEGGQSVRNYFNYLCSNNVIIASVGDPNANGGRNDTWNTSNANYCIDSLLSYCQQRWAFSNVFLWGESAGGSTAFSYAMSKHIQGSNFIAGIIGNHCVWSPSNTYNAGINVSDINSAYGGSTAAQLALATNGSYLTGDTSGITNLLYGIPIHITQSFGDTVVRKTNQTDILVRLLGGTPATSNATPTLTITTNGILTPEISDYGVNGQGGVHGDLCYGTDVASNDVAFIKRCRIYAAHPWINPAFPTASGTSYQLQTNGVTPSTLH